MLAASGQTLRGQEQAVYGCYNRSSGTLRQVTDGKPCKPDEIFISWTAPKDGGSSHPANPRTEAQPPASTRISVYDAEDQFLGLLLDAKPSRDPGGDGRPAARGSLTLYLPELDKFIELAEDGSSITADFSSKPFYYDRLNCQGNAYLIDPASFYFVHEQKDLDGSSRFAVPLWVPELPCFEFESKESGGECGTVSAEEGSSCRAVPLLEVSLPFNLPLSMPLKCK